MFVDDQSLQSPNSIAMQFPVKEFYFLFLFFWPGSKWAFLQYLFQSSLQLTLNLPHFLFFPLHAHFSLFSSQTTLVQFFSDYHLASFVPCQFILFLISKSKIINFPCYRRMTEPALTLTSELFLCQYATTRLVFFPKAIWFSRTTVGCWINICS